MANTIDGQFSIAEIMQLTYSSKYRTRFKYAKRDVIKKVLIKKEFELHPDRPNSPTIRYLFESKSFPQYSPYNKHTSGRQKKYHHEYDQILSIVSDADGTFSVNSTKWKYRLGSQKKWVDHPPQAQIKSIYRETAAKWKAEYEKEVLKIKRKYSLKVDRDRALAKAKAEYKAKIAQHRKTAKYLDSGDFNSRVHGINGDFYSRVAGPFAYWGHLYGRNVSKEIGDISKPFAPKHMIALVNFLMQKGILHE